MVRIARPLSPVAAALLLSACAQSAERADAREAAPAAAGPVHFIRETRPTTVGKEALGLGVLTLDAKGCLRLNGGPALVWPAEAALDLTEPGVVKIFDRSGGSAIHVGQRVALGGGSFPSDDPPPLNRPPAPCGGELWDVDSFEPAADFEARHPHVARAPVVPPKPPRA